MERKIYALPGLQGRFIFDFKEPDTNSPNDLQKHWEVQVVSLPGIPNLDNTTADLSDLMISRKQDGVFILLESKGFFKSELPAAENVVIEYCRAYLSHVKTGVPINQFF